VVCMATYMLSYMPPGAVVGWVSHLLQDGTAMQSMLHCVNKR
jgi:hypothetical protein